MPLTPALQWFPSSPSKTRPAAREPWALLGWAAATRCAWHKAKRNLQTGPRVVTHAATWALQYVLLLVPAQKGCGWALPPSLSPSWVQ